jgi:hypothetical protein
MSGTLMESEAVFRARCLAVGLEASKIQKLLDEQINTMAKLAFVCGVQPGSHEDKEFVEIMKQVLAVDPIPVGVLSALRRLWFEANAMAISDVKSRYEKTDESAPKKVPLPEREHRRLHQQSLLTGIKIEGNLEPAHSLVDLAMAIKEEDVVRYICPTACISREQEIKGLKKETLIKADSMGQLRSVTKDLSPHADISSEYRLRLALQRRSLALDQMNLMSYHKSESYHSYMFDLLMRAVPSSHKPITVHQLMEADKHIWARMAELCRTGLSVTASGSYPMETALDAALSDPITVSLLQPLPAGSNSYRPLKEYDSFENRQAPWQPSGKGKKGKGKGKNSKGSKGFQQSTQQSIRLPEGLQGSSITKNGRRICFGFNLGTCSSKDCQKGVHVCCKCFQNSHSFQSCPSKN